MEERMISDSEIERKINRYVDEYVLLHGNLPDDEIIIYKVLLGVLENENERDNYKYFLIIDILDYADRHNIILRHNQSYYLLWHAYILSEDNIFFYLLKRYPEHRRDIIKRIKTNDENIQLHQLFKNRGDYGWRINSTNMDRLDIIRQRNNQDLVNEELSYMPPIRTDRVIYPGGSEYMRSNESFSKGLSGGFGRRRSRGW